MMMELGSVEPRAPLRRTLRQQKKPARELPASEPPPLRTRTGRSGISLRLGLRSGISTDCHILLGHRTPSFSPRRTSAEADQAHLGRGLKTGLSYRRNGV